MPNPTLYFIPGADRSSDRLVRASAIAASGTRRTLSESGEPIPYLMQCEYRDSWGSLDEVAHALRLGLDQRAPLEIDDCAPDWSRGRGLITADGRVHFVTFERDRIVARRMPVEVSIADMAHLREPGLRHARIEREVQTALAEAGWTALVNHTACAALDVPESIGEQQAFAYLSRFDWERVNCTLSAEFRSEGDNQCTSCSVLLPWDATLSAVRSAAVKFAQDVAQSVDQAFSVRMARAERQR